MLFHKTKYWFEFNLVAQTDKSKNSGNKLLELVTEMFWFMWFDIKSSFDDIVLFEGIEAY